MPDLGAWGLIDKNSGKPKIKFPPTIYYMMEARRCLWEGGAAALLARRAALHRRSGSAAHHPSASPPAPPLGPAARQPCLCPAHPTACAL